MPSIQSYPPFPQRTFLYGVLLPPETRPPTAAAGVEAMPEEGTAAEEVMALLAAVLAGHMMMIPLSSPRFVRLVRLLASARMVKVVEDCSAGVRVTMVMPALWYLFSFCESSNSHNDYRRMSYFISRPSVLFLLVLSNVARTTRSSDRFVCRIVYYVQRREEARSTIT